MSSRYLHLLLTDAVQTLHYTIFFITTLQNFQTSDIIGILKNEK